MFDARTMPVATFRCALSGDQASARLTRFVREQDAPDKLRPVPDCPNPDCARYGRPMTEVVQIDYEAP